MSVLDNASKFGKPNQNLVLETAGRIWIKVQDRFYELKFKDLDARIENASKKGSTTIINNEVASDEPDLSDYVSKKYLKATLNEYVTKRSWNSIKETTSMLENALLDGFTESISPISINTMQVVVGSEQLQYDFIQNYDDGTVVPGGFIGDNALTQYRVRLTGGWIKHYSLDGPQAVRPKGSWSENGSTVTNTQELLTQYCRWYINDAEFELDDGSYYVYIKVPKLKNLSDYHDGYPEKDNNSGLYYFNEGEKFNNNTHVAASHSLSDALLVKTNALCVDSLVSSATNISLTNIPGEFVISQEAIELDATEEGQDYYYLLYALINSADDGGSREYSTMNGFTEITPGRVTAYRFMSPDGQQYLNFLDKTFHLGDAALANEISLDGPSRNTNSYIHWDPINGLVIKGSVKVTGGDLENVLNLMQAQIDGQTQTWFSSDANNDNSLLTPPSDPHCEPTIDTWPAHTWFRVEQDENEQDVIIYEYDNHLGDMIYITDDTQAYIDDQNDPKQELTYKGKCYRFAKTTDANNNDIYSWIEVSDSSLAESLRLAYENQQAIAGYEYLKEALKDTNSQTVTNGGLILTSLIQLGQWADTNDDEVVDTIAVHAGINGVYRKTDNNNQKTYRDIAAWYGGAMRDKEDYYTWNNSTHTWVLNSGISDPGDIAKTVFRHDGSGYLANGNIYWDNDGSLRVPGITLNASTGRIELDSGIIVSGTNTSLANYDAFFELDSNGDLHIIGNRGLWTNGFGSFGGLNSSSESGSVNLERVWQSISGDNEYTNYKVNTIHLNKASAQQFGVVKIGSGITVNDGVISVNNSGSNISIANGTGISITGDNTKTISLSNEYITTISNLGTSVSNISTTVSGLETSVSTLSTDVTALLGRTNWDNYFGINNNNVYVKPIDANTTRGFYNEGYICAGGISVSQPDFIQRMWQSLDKTYTDSVASLIDISFIPKATKTNNSSTYGVVKPGNGLAIDSTTGELYVDGTVTGGIDINSVGTGLYIDNNILYLDKATTSSAQNAHIGGVMIGSGLTLANSGEISVTDPVTNYLEIVNNNTTLHAISDRNFYTNGYICAGGIAADEPNFIARVWNSLKGSTADPNSGLISNSFIPPATSSALGGVKVANNSGLTLTNDGSLSVTNPNGSGGTVTAVKFDSSVTYALNTNYEPASNSSVISLPAYPTVDNSWTEFIEVDDNGDVHILPKTVNGVETPRGFYNEGWGSFGGINSSSSDTVDLDRVWQSLTNELSDTHVSEKIHRNHIPTATNNAVGGIIASNVLNSAVTLTSGNGSTANRYYGVQVDNTGKAFVNVPWQESTQYTLPVATSDTLGGIKIGYTTTSGSRNYAVTLEQSTNRAYVNVPDYTANEIVTILDNTPVKRATGDGSGNEIISSYGASLTVNTNALSLIAKNGATTLSTLTGDNIETVLNDRYVKNTGDEMTGSLIISGSTGNNVPNGLYLGSSDNPYMYWDSSNNAWHLSGNLIADGYGSFGGVNSSTSGFASLLSVWRSLTNDPTMIEPSNYNNVTIDINHIPSLSDLYQSKYNFTITGIQGASYNLANFTPTVPNSVPTIDTANTDITLATINNIAIKTRLGSPLKSNITIGESNNNKSLTVYGGFESLTSTTDFRVGNSDISMAATDTNWRHCLAVAKNSGFNVYSYNLNDNTKYGLKVTTTGTYVTENSTDYPILSGVGGVKKIQMVIGSGAISNPVDGVLYIKVSS